MCGMNYNNPAETEVHSRMISNFLQQQLHQVLLDERLVTDVEWLRTLRQMADNAAHHNALTRISTPLRMWMRQIPLSTYDDTEWQEVSSQQPMSEPGLERWDPR